MSRFKFRGQRIDNGEWVLGNGIIEMNDKTLIVDKFNSGATGRTFEVTDSTIGQFTGLYDRNGKPIFEGDKVKWTSTYSGASKKVHEDEIQWRLHGWMLMPFYHELHAADMEVIGTIHDQEEN